MDKEELINKGKYYPQSDKEPLPVFRINLDVPLFNKEVSIEAFNLQSIEFLSIQMELLIDIINEILNYDQGNIEWIKDQIWQHYNSCMTNSSYNMVDQSGFSSEEDANRAFFNIENRDEAYKKANLYLIHFDLNQTDYRHFNLCFDCPWEEEHGITMCVIDGELNYIE